MGSNPRFKWNDPPAPIAVPDSTLSHIEGFSHFSFGKFFENLWGKKGTPFRERVVMYGFMVGCRGIRGIG